MKKSLDVIKEIQEMDLQDVKTNQETSYKLHILLHKVRALAIHEACEEMSTKAFHLKRSVDYLLTE